MSISNLYSHERYKKRVVLTGKSKPTTFLTYLLQNDAVVMTTSLVSQTRKIANDEAAKLELFLQLLLVMKFPL